MKEWIFGLCALAALGPTVFSSSAASQQSPLNKQLVGTWRIVSVILTRPDGSKAEPFGGNVRGGLIFTSDGDIALINARSDLPKIASNNRLQGTPDEYQAIMRGTHAFFGTYTVDETDKSFTIIPISSTFPNELGNPSIRAVTSIDASELRFTYSQPAGGGTVEQVWKRAR